MNFLQATCFVHAHREAVNHIVIHTAEVPCVRGLARRLVLAWNRLDPKDPATRKRSAHFAVDPAEIWQGVHESDVALHCPKANSRGIGIEHCCYALDVYSQKRGADGKRKLLARATDFASAEAQSMLLLSARLAARLAIAWDVPVVKLSPHEVLAGARGFVGHVDVARAYPGSSSHVDPGPRFPWDKYLDLIKRERPMS